MFGGITAREKLLVVADAAGSGQVQVFDLEDRRLASRFHFEGAQARVDVGGIALGEDSSLWIPDTQGHSIRRFSLFGHESGSFGSPAEAVKRDRRSLVVSPRAVALDSQQRLWVCCGERPWVHGLQVFERDGSFVRSVASRGRREACFGPATGLCIHRERVWVADFGKNAVQCFREDGGFVGAQELGDFGQPLSIAVWDEGQAVLVLQPAPMVLLFDRNFCRIAQVTAPPEQPLQQPSGLVALGDEILVLDRDATRVRSFGQGGEYRETIFDATEW